MMLLPSFVYCCYHHSFLSLVQENFRTEIAGRGKEFKDTIFSFGSAEEEDYALWYVLTMPTWDARDTTTTPEIHGAPLTDSVCDFPL